MTDVNPYAAPRSDEVLSAQIIEPSGGIWRDGKRLVMWKGATLPDRCVRCDAPANGRRLVRKLYWHHPAFYLLLFLGALGALAYIIVMFVIRKKAVVPIGLCDRHYRRRMRSILAWWMITFACAALLLYGIAMSDRGQGWAILVAVALFLGNLFFAVAITLPVSPARIDDQYVWLKKISPDYLAQFPPLPP